MIISYGLSFVRNIVRLLHMDTLRSTYALRMLFSSVFDFADFWQRLKHNDHFRDTLTISRELSIDSEIVMQARPSKQANAITPKTEKRHKHAMSYNKCSPVSYNHINTKTIEMGNPDTINHHQRHAMHFLQM